MKNFKYILIVMAFCGSIHCINAETTLAPGEVLTNVDSKDNGKQKPVECVKVCNAKHLFFNGQYWHNDHPLKDHNWNSIICQCTNIKEHEKPAKK